MAQKMVHVFLSYTTREEEVRAIQPLVDQYCRGLWEWGASHGLNVFYDHFSMEVREYSQEELVTILGGAVARSRLFTAFLSPSYVESRWCCFEWEQAKSRAIDLPRAIHPICWKPDLRSATPYSAGVAREILGSGWMDVTYAYAEHSEIPRAARECVAASARALIACCPELFDRR